MPPEATVQCTVPVQYFYSRALNSGRWMRRCVDVTATILEGLVQFGEKQASKTEAVDQLLKTITRIDKNTYKCGFGRG